MSTVEVILESEMCSAFEVLEAQWRFTPVLKPSSEMVTSATMSLAQSRDCGTWSLKLHKLILAADPFKACYVPQCTITFESSVEQLAKHDGGRWISASVTLRV